MYGDKSTAFSSIDPSILVNVVSDDTTALLSGLGGAVLGALVSAIFSWLMYRSSVKREIANERRHRISAEKSSALSALVRLQSAVNLCLDLRSRIIDSLTQAQQGGYGDFQAWQKIHPITGIPPSLAPFQTDELSLLFSAKKPETANELIRFYSRIISLTEALRTYNEVKNKVKDLMPAHMIGMVGTSSLSYAEYVKVSPFIAECQDLISQIMAAILEDGATAIKLSVLLSSDLNEYFGDTSYRTLFKSEEALNVSILEKEIERGAQDIDSAFVAVVANWPPNIYPALSMTFGAEPKTSK